jgi:hypothetical protein
MTAQDHIRDRWAQIEATYIAGTPVPTREPDIADYRGFRIYYDPPPIPDRNYDWHFVADDYEAEMHSENVWISNGRAGDGRTRNSCIDQVNELLAEEAWERARADNEDMGSDE